MNKTIFIFDWDDTLFPSTYFTNNNFIIDKSILDMIDNIVYKIIKKCNKYGKIYIVSNALNIWLNFSIPYLPKSHKFFTSKNIPIISARELYSHKYDNIESWKFFSFFSILDELNTKKFNNVFSFGDSVYEYNSLKNIALSQKFNLYFKIIKFIKHPSLNEFIEQLDNLNTNLKKMINYNYHLDLFYE